MTRSEILSRYRRLRQISKEQHEAVLDIIAPDVVLDWAKRIDLTQGDYFKQRSFAFLRAQFLVNDALPSPAI